MKIPNSSNTTRIMSELAKHADGNMELVYHAMNIALKRYKTDIHPDSVKNIIDELKGNNKC